MDYIEKIKYGATTAFIDSTNKSSAAYKPEFISNDHTNGVKVLVNIKEGDNYETDNNSILLRKMHNM